MQEDEKNLKIKFKNMTEKMPEYKLEKIFEKFYGADESRATSTGGTGLGLAIAKKIIELHKGTISVENKDKYICFYVNLPKEL